MAPAATQQVFRFAPSPNGYLHLGHACSALINHDAAMRTGGRFLLRLEDIDVGRCRPEYEIAILEDLAWLGLAWEQPVRRQSEHFGDYASALDQLVQRGVAYPCFCSRSEIADAVAGREGWPRDPDGAALYPGTCRELSTDAVARHMAGGIPAAFRLNVTESTAEAGTLLGWREFGQGAEGRDVRAEPQVWGDAIIARRDVPTSYHLAVVVDDAAQGVTDVIRGADLLQATSLHRLLQELLGLPAPNYHHHRLMLDGEGRKLSKSIASHSIRSLRLAGATVADIWQMAQL